MELDEDLAELVPPLRRGRVAGDETAVRGMAEAMLKLIEEVQLLRNALRPTAPGRDADPSGSV